MTVQLSISWSKVEFFHNFIMSTNNFVTTETNYFLVNNIKKQRTEGGSHTIGYVWF